MAIKDDTKRLSGTAVALSGGGFRAATLFHIGSLQRLNEPGKLKVLKEITSVSGGSITAGWLGFRWQDLIFYANNVATNFTEIIASSLRSFCSQTIDVGSIVGGILSLFRHSSQKLTSKYNKHLFHTAFWPFPAMKSFIIFRSSIKGTAVRNFGLVAVISSHLSCQSVLPVRGKG